MTKKKLSCLFLTLLLLMVPATGCQYWDNWTNSGSGSGSSSGSGSGTGSSTQAEQPHGQVTVNLMERTPFNGRDLDPAFWSQMEAFCKAGPTHLILADLNASPEPNDPGRISRILEGAALCPGHHLCGHELVPFCY